MEHTLIISLVAFTYDILRAGSLWEQFPCIRMRMICPLTALHPISIKAVLLPINPC